MLTFMTNMAYPKKPRRDLRSNIVSVDTLASSSLVIVRIINHTVHIGLSNLNLTTAAKCPINLIEISVIVCLRTRVMNWVMTHDSQVMCPIQPFTNQRNCCGVMFQVMYEKLTLRFPLRKNNDKPARRAVHRAHVLSTPKSNQGSLLDSKFIELG